MINILNHFKIKNERIEAIDGNLIENINEKYFYSSSGNYPKNSNKEYAILLSHLNTIEKFIYLNEDDLKFGIAMICEDDISLDFIQILGC